MLWVLLCAVQLSKMYVVLHDSVAAVAMTFVEPGVHVLQCAPCA